MSKTWLITGASSGLGLIMAQRLLERGDRVVATVRRPDVLNGLRAQHAETLQVEVLELTDTPAMRNMVEKAFDAMGRIDVIVSNAGFGLFGAAEELSDLDIDRQIATNLTGSIQLIRAVLPYLRAQGGGRIVQVSSEGGQIAYPNFSLYHATKWGIEGFVESVRQEVVSFGIDFLIVEPGPTNTNFGAGLAHATPMPVYDDTVAGAVRRGVLDGSFSIKGDASRTVAAMIEASDCDRPPLRLALGSSAYNSISASLTARLGAIEAQRALAFSADA